MSAVKLSEQRCPSCNAPLQVGAADATVTCRYCGNSISIQRQKGRVAPPVTTFGSPGHVPSTVLYIPTAATVGASVLPALIPLVIVIVVALVGAISALGRRFVSLPVTCRPNETITISGKKYDGKETPIVAGVNCKITIKDSTLTSTEPIVKGGINLELRIVNSKLTSKATALDLSATNAKVWISDKSEVHGDEAGLHGENNVELEVKDSTVSGGQDGLSFGSNAKVSLVSATIKGKEHGIHSTSGAKVTSKGSTITSDEAGVVLESSGGSFDARSTTIKSGDVGLSLEHNADVKLAEKSSIASTKGDAVSCKGSTSKLQIEDTKIEGHEAGLRLGGNSELRLRKGAQVKGDALGITADYNLKLTVDGATVESAGPAVQGKTGAEVRVTAGSQVKGSPAFTFASNPSRFDVAEGTTTGEKQLDGRSAAQATRPSDMSAMRSVLDASSAQVRSCKDAKGGALQVRIEVAASGKVTSATAVSSTVSKAVESCALAKVRALTFPARSGTTTIQMGYTL